MSQRLPRWGWSLAEWVLLALAAPFLLFPHVKPGMTVLALGLLLLFWLTALIRRQPWPVTPFNGALLLFVLMVGVGISVTLLPELTLPKATGLILGLALFRATAQVRGRGRLWLALGGLASAATGIWVLGVLGLQWPAKIPALRAWLNRLPQPFSRLPGAPAEGINPNQLAGVMVLILPLPLAALIGGELSRGSLPRRLLGLAGVMAWGTTLFFTQSRGGWMGGLAGSLVLLSLCGLSGDQRWQRRVGLALPLLALVMGAIILVSLGPERVGELLYGAAEGEVESPAGTISLQGRLEIWSRALCVIHDFPFTGCGLGTFRRLVWLHYPLFLISPERDIAHAHNVFLQIALDLGLPGLVSYLAILLLAGWVGWQRVRRGSGDRWLALGVLAGLVGYHVYGLADALAPGSKPSFLFWWLLGLLVGEEPWTGA